MFQLRIFKPDFLLFIDNLLPPQTNDFFGSIFEDIAKIGEEGCYLLSLYCLFF